MIEIRKMKSDDIKDLHRLDKKCFAIPWSEEAFRNEYENELAIYFILVDEMDIIGYAGMWNVVGEGHITNIAVHPRYRGQGLSKRLMNALFCAADEYKLSCLTLEVRESNFVAKGLYEKYGFKDVGRRKKYYSDTNEDAIVMTAELFESPEQYYSKIIKGDE